VCGVFIGRIFTILDDMTPNAVELMTPRILVVDDERQIQASLRLRLGHDYELTCCSSAREALARLQRERFDLCFADIHMPHMNGLSFIETARELDPELGYVILSAFDTDENLRRAIPLQVYDFLSKPFPDRGGFEARIPEWIETTRRRRRDRALAGDASVIAGDRDAARLERDVEVVASETARDALLQTANLLTTIHAHLVAATGVLAQRAKGDPASAHLLRGLDEARKTADAAVTVAEGFFDSAYGSRDSSPALVDSGLRHAIGIAKRMGQVEHATKSVDLAGFDDRLPINGLSGIQFLLMMVPAIGAALTAAPSGSTVRIEAGGLSRLDYISRDPTLKAYLWINRRHAIHSQSGQIVSLAAAGPALTRAQAEAWLKGDYPPFAHITARGLIHGIQKCRGVLGFAVAPEYPEFRLALVLPN
jgi:CheY-like chemotaxis protein